MKLSAELSNFNKLELKLILLKGVVLWYNRKPDLRLSLIHILENDIERIDAEMSKCATDYGKLNDLSKEKAEKEQQLEEKMDRWVYLKMCIRDRLWIMMMA